MENFSVKHVSAPAVLCLLPLFSASAQLPEPTVLTPAVRQYEMVEIALTPQRVPKNPFNPNLITLDAIVTLPSGKQVRVPGFWFQGYRRSIANPNATGADRVEVLAPEGKPGWRVRYSSGAAGVHRAVLELKDPSGVRRSREVTFTVSAGQHPGVIRVSPRNRQYLEDASGRVFFPIGQNLCMYEKKEGTYYFDRLFQKLAAAGGNYVRLWQEYYVPQDPKIVAGAGDGSHAGFPLETQATGLGRYDLESAWRLDYVAGLCERLNIRWQITFEMVVWWEQSMKHRWPRNPYNTANGGPCAKPLDYLTNPVARELVRRRLRYSVARWGWTTNLAAWELWNEVDNMDGFDSKACANWHREMSGYLKSIDPWRHLVTTSWRDRAMFSVPEIDIVQGHSYFEPEYDAAEYALQDTDHLMRGYGKPFFFGEQGIEGPVSVDPEGKHFHDCIWATALSGAAGTGMYWWWHNYIDTYNLYRHYTPLAKFVSDEDFAARQWKPVRLSRPSLPVQLNVYGLIAADRALVWIHDPLAFRLIGGKAVRGAKQTAASVNVVGLADGAYEIEWWDTSSGAVVRHDRANVRQLRHFGYGLEMKPPEFWGDIAARVVRVAR
jgi:Domain of unknown function (DUF5060)